MQIKTIIIAKHSPKNQCLAQEGEMLIAASPGAKSTIRLRKGSHFFIGLESGQQSAVGWTAPAPEGITIEKILMQAVNSPQAKLLGGNEDSIQEQIQFTLEYAQNYEPGKPVVTDFTERSFDDKTQVQTIHRVFLQKMAAT